MMREIAAVVFFLKRLVKKGEKMEADKIELFVERLAAALQEKFKGHWYPDSPSKGQAYRCIRINRVHRQDPDLLRACRESGVKYGDLGLPRELTLWVDPGEVCCRYGEQNPCFSVATFSNDDEDDKDVAKKVTSALERVTSDYHSGSSSDEESTRSSPLTVPNSRWTQQAMNPRAPCWLPTKVAAGKGPAPPRPHYGYRARGRAPHSLRAAHQQGRREGQHRRPAHGLRRRLRPASVSALLDFYTTPLSPVLQSHSIKGLVGLWLH